MSSADLTDSATISSLVDALNKAGVAKLEIEKPGQQLSIVLYSDKISLGKSKDKQTISIKAAIAGEFVTRDPSHKDATLPGLNEPCSKDSVLGFLRIGPVLLPVSTPVDGKIVSCCVEAGTLVGFGDALFEVEPL